MKSIELLPLVRALGLCLYFIIAAQGAFYHFGFGKALYQIPSGHFIELRRTVDPVVRTRFKVVYLAALAVMFAWLFMSDKTHGFLAYAPVLGAVLLLLGDMGLILRFSEPANAMISEHTFNAEMATMHLRRQWLETILLRGYLSITGFFLLILHLLHQMK